MALQRIRYMYREIAQKDKLTGTQYGSRPERCYFFFNNLQRVLRMFCHPKMSSYFFTHLVRTILHGSLGRMTIHETDLACSVNREMAVMTPVHLCGADLY